MKKQNQVSNKESTQGDISSLTNKKNADKNQPSIVIAKKSKPVVVQNSSWMSITGK
jgi:hypothetical protein